MTLNESPACEHKTEAVINDTGKCADKQKRSPFHVKSFQTSQQSKPASFSTYTSIASWEKWWFDGWRCYTGSKIDLSVSSLGVSLAKLFPAKRLNRTTWRTHDDANSHGKQQEKARTMLSNRSTQKWILTGLVPLVSFLFRRNHPNERLNVNEWKLSLTLADSPRP